MSIKEKLLMFYRMGIEEAIEKASKMNKRGDRSKLINSEMKKLLNLALKESLNKLVFFSLSLIIVHDNINV